MKTLLIRKCIKCGGRVARIKYPNSIMCGKCKSKIKIK